MLVAEKPPLDEDLLMHFGVKGMRWGRRKARDSGDRGGSSKTSAKPKMSTGKKVAIGAAVIAGTAAVVALGTRTGRAKVAEIMTTSFVQRRNQQKQKSPFEGLLPKQVMQTKVKDVPSPQAMMVDARRAAGRNRVLVDSNRQLVDKAWRDEARLGRARRIPSLADVAGLRSRPEHLNVGSVSAIRRALQDPDHVWEL